MLARMFMFQSCSHYKAKYNVQWHEKKKKKNPRKHKNMESDLDFESKIWTLNCPIGFN